MEKYNTNISQCETYPFNRSYYFWCQNDRLPLSITITQSFDWGFEGKNSVSNSCLYFIFPEFFKHPDFIEILALSGHSVVLIKKPVANVQNLLTEEERSSITCFSCPVCLNDNVALSNGTKTPCGHLFCSDCITKWVTLQHLTTCPLCRHNIC